MALRLLLAPRRLHRGRWLSVGSRCKSCGAPIEWVQTIKGHNMPLDPEPVAGGNIELTVAGLAYTVPPDPDVIRSVSHFVTCPEAKSHRRRKR